MRAELCPLLCQLLAWTAGGRFYSQLASALGEGAYSSLASNALSVDWGPHHSLLLFFLNLRWVELELWNILCSGLGTDAGSKVV